MVAPSRNLLQERLDTMLHSAQVKYGTTLDAIGSQQDLMKDMVVPHGIGGKLTFGWDNTNKHIFADVDGYTAPERFVVSAHAATQAGEKFGVPGKYIREMAFASEPWKRELVSDVLNRHAVYGTRDRTLLRAVGGDLRAVLSDRYRRLNSGLIARQVLEGGHTVGAEVYNAFAEDTQVGIDMIVPQVFEIPMARNGVDFQAFGFRWRNSDFGDGAHTLSMFVMRLVCTNGMIGESMLRQVHLGARLPDNIEISESTYRLDTETQASLVKDILGTVLSRDFISNRIRRMQDAADTERAMEEVVATLPRLGVQKGEMEALSQMLIKNDIADVPEGPLTNYKLSQALSAVARGAGSRRRRDLEELAGSFIFKS